MEYSNNARRYYGESSGSSVGAWGTAGAWLAVIFAVLAFTFAEMAWKNGAEVAEANTALVKAVASVKALEYTLLGNTANVTLDSSCDDLNECTGDYKDRTGNCVYRNKPTSFSCTVNPCNATCPGGVCSLVTGTCSNGKCAGGSCVGICASSATCPPAADLGIKNSVPASIVAAPTCTASRCQYKSTEQTVATVVGSAAFNAGNVEAGSYLLKWCNDALVGTPYGSCLSAQWFEGSTSATLNFYCIWTFTCSRPAV
jgi:hypothetical protein